MSEAAQLMEWEQANIVRSSEARQHKPGEPGYGPEFCSVPYCEDDMPTARREWGFTKCVHCQSIAEIRASGRR